MQNNNTKTVQEIMKKLDSFKEAKEWSDFMTSLTALDKILTHEKRNIDIFTFPIIQLNKRLNQSLNPALPPGIHFKAIQIYSVLIEKLSTYINNLNSVEKTEFELNRTHKVFFLLLTGFFAFSANLKIQTRPAYFALINKQILSLNISLNEHIRNILLGLLCGLDEDIDFATRTHESICTLYNRVDKHSFWNHLWNIFLVLPEQRIYVINFILKSESIVDECKNDFRKMKFDTDTNVIDLDWQHKVCKHSCTIFYYLNEAYFVQCLVLGLSSNNPIVQRGTLDILKILFEYEDFSAKSQLDLMFEFVLIYSLRDSGLIKRIECFIDKNGEFLALIDEFENAFKINQKEEETTTPYTTLIAGFRKRMKCSIEGFLIYIKAMIYIEERGDINDYFDNNLFIESLYELYKYKDHKDKNVIIAKFDILLTQMEIWSISFLLYNHTNNIFKVQNIGKNDTTKEVDYFFEVLMYFFNNTKIMNDEIYKLHFSALIILVMQNCEMIDNAIFTNFLIYSIDYLPNTISKEITTAEQAYNLAVDYYNLELDDNLTLIYNSSKTLFERELVILIQSNFNLPNKIDIIIKYIMLFGNEVLNQEVCHYIYTQLLDYLKKDDLNLPLIKKVDELYKCADKSIFESFFDGGGLQLYTLLLNQNKYDALFAYNSIFHRNFENFIVKDYMNGQHIEQIYDFLSYVLNYQENPYFYNLFIVIIMNQKLVTNVSVITKVYYDLDLHQEFLASIIHYEHIFRFLINLILDANIDSKNFEYIDEVNTEHVLCGLLVINYLLRNSTSFIDYLTNKKRKISLGRNFLDAEVDTYKSLLYNIALRLLCVNCYQIQNEAIDLINLLLEKQVINAENVVQYFDRGFLAFLEQLKHKSIFLKCYQIIIIMFKTGDKELQNNIFGIFEKINLSAQIAREHLYLILQFDDCPIKMKILSLLCVKTENLDIKFHIYKYLKTKNNLCDRIQLYTIISNLVLCIVNDFDTLYNSFIRTPLFCTRRAQTNLVDKVISHLLREDESMFIDCILSIKENCSFFKDAQQKVTIYELLYKRLSRITVKFFLSYESNLSNDEIITTFTNNYQSVLNFYTGYKNKLNLSDYYVWLIRKIKIDQSLILKYLDFMAKNFEMMNLLLYKYSDFSAKNISANERNETIVSLIQNVSSVVSLFRSEKHKLGCQSFFGSIFFALKSNNLEQQTTALECFSQISVDTSLHKYWRKEYLDYMMEPTFFKVTRENFLLQMQITKQLFSSDPQRINVIIDKFKVSGFFTSKDIEIGQRIRVLIRLAFVVLSSEKDALGHAIPQILEWVVEFINNGGNTIKLHTYFCVKFLFYRADPNKISIVWPTLVADISSMFEVIIDKGLIINEYPLLLQMLKFLEVIFILNVESTIEMKWGTVQPQPLAGENSELNSFYIHRIFEELKKAKQISENKTVNSNVQTPVGLLNNAECNDLGGFVNNLANLTAYYHKMEIEHSKMSTFDIESKLIDDFVCFLELSNDF